ncbi:GNAT family N-acetyltransferase [Bacillus sp. FSL K6-4563]|uniref:GNAT family N-acetyltransferase n=1 Tax=Bacillus sp. FSL K6-4563 TaxID=2921507 RepID=UPI00315A8B1F
MSYEEEQIGTIEKYAARFASVQLMWTFGAFDQGKLVGMVTLIQENLQKLKHRANVAAMYYVTAGARGKGVGKTLMYRSSFIRRRTTRHRANVFISRDDQSLSQTPVSLYWI